MLLLQTNPPIPEPSLWGSFFKVFGLLALMLFACYFVLRFLGRRNSGLRERSPGGRLELVDRLNLEPRRSLYVLRVGGQYVAIASTEAGIQVLKELNPESVIDATPSTERGQRS